MYKNKLLLASFIAITFCWACSDSKKGNENNILADLKMPVKADIVGAITDGTTMNMLEVVDANGDTTSIEIGNDRFFGDKDTGDSVVVSYITIDNELISSTIININNLQHTWAMEPDEKGTTKYMEIDPKGFVHVFVNRKEDPKYEKWKLEDGILLLIPPADSINSVKTDSLEIVSLNADTMTVKKNNKKIKLSRYN